MKLLGEKRTISVESVVAQATCATGNANGCLLPTMWRSRLLGCGDHGGDTSQWPVAQSN